MRRLSNVAAVVIAALAVANCATTMTVSSHMERGLDFARYRTFVWGPPDALPTGDPRLDQNPFFKDHLQGAVERQLAVRGIDLSADGTADLLIHYHANITQRIDINRLDSAYGYCSGGNCSGDIVEYEAGTLVLDIIDARSNLLIWRGWARDSVENVLDDPDRMARMINEAVTRMLQRLPRTL